MRELDGKVVLVVDDHAKTLAAITAILEAADATVETATSLTQAVGNLQRVTRTEALPDAVVCDLRLSAGSGAGLPGELRRLYPSWRPALIAMSAFAEHEDAARDAGFDDFLPKMVVTLLPVTLAELFRRQR